MSYIPYIPYKFNAKDIKDTKNIEECSICLENQNKTTVKLNICDHLYHEKCIKMSLQKSNLCPLCRKDVYDNYNYNICNTCIII